MSGDGGDRIPVNDLARSSLRMRDETLAALARVAESGRYLQGAECRSFEAEFAEFVGVDWCVGVANGTDAIELALLGVGCAPGDEILTAANAGMYATTAALRAGLRVRYADVDETSLCLSPQSVAAAIGPETKALVVTHLYGRVAEVEEIVALCREQRIAVVEDCAQAAGAERGGARAGSFADAAAFSFYPTKNLGALGDAGAVLTRRADVADRVRRLSQYGWGEKYEVVLPHGRNSRLDEVQAAVLRLRLPHLREWNAARRDVVRRYAASLSEGSGRFVTTPDDGHSAHLAVFLAADRRAATERLAAVGVETAVHYPVPDHRQPVWGGAFEGLELPVTEQSASRVLTVPCFPELEDSEVDRICEALGGL